MHGKQNTTKHTNLDRRPCNVLFQRNELPSAVIPRDLLCSPSLHCSFLSSPANSALPNVVLDMLSFLDLRLNLVTQLERCVKTCGAICSLILTFDFGTAQEGLCTSRKAFTLFLPCKKSLPNSFSSDTAPWLFWVDFTLVHYFLHCFMCLLLKLQNLTSTILSVSRLCEISIIFWSAIGMSATWSMKCD